MNDFNSKSKKGLLWFSDKKRIMQFLLYALGSALICWLFGENGRIFLIILGILGIVLVSFLIVSRTIFFPDLEDKHNESESVDDFINRI